MRNDDILIGLHIGSMIKKIAIQKQVAAKKIAEAINRYDGNADKIFKLDDMYIEDVIAISHLLKYDFLKIISDKYLPHIQFTGNLLKQGNFLITLEFPSNSFRIRKNSIKQKELEMHIGSYIKDLAKKKGIREQYIANQIGVYSVPC